MITTRPDARTIDRVAVIARFANRLGTPEKQREADGEAGARKERDPDDLRHESGREMKAHASRQGQVVDLGKDLIHVRNAARACAIEGHGRAVEGAERVGRLVVFRLGRHRGPVAFDGGPEIVDKALAELGGFRLRSIGVVEQCCGGGGFPCDRGLALAELFPDRDDNKGKQHGVNHADDRENEPGDLVVEGEAINADRAPDEKLESDCDGRRDNDQNENKLPERKLRQDISH